MLRVLLSGPAGSGKNTIAKMLLKEFDQFGYFSAGDVIRDHIQRGTEFGQRAASFVRKGELIPDSIVSNVLLEEIRNAGNKLILNGYPRSMCQVKMIEEVAPLDLVVELKVPKKVLIDRLSKQLVHHGSGRTYNLDFNPPKVEGKDDITGEPLFKRDDDAAEVVRRRLEVHEKTESKVVDYYRNHGICVTMSGDKSSTVFHAVSEMITDLLKKRAFG
ncbi:unnamed protein product [Haemonchus placei]|uniref:Guanylate kinase-like domain-containing protein n=1 Tax=Haemonchus placei TaxID=6290 RepID=A0A0N4W559_HAEPC|nr:unnamed protein product [Haemonchus placei]